MALTVDNTGHLVGAFNTSNPHTWSHTCNTGANLLLMMLAAGASSTGERDVDSATYNSVAGTEVANADNTTFEGSAIYVLANPTADGNSHTISMHTAGNPAPNGQYAGYSISFTGALTTLGASGTVIDANTGAANPSTGPIATNPGDILVAVYASDLGPGGTSTESGTLIFEDEDVDGDSDFAAQYVVAVGSTTTATWTAPSFGPGQGGWAISYAVVQQDSGSSRREGGLMGVSGYGFRTRLLAT